MSPSVKAVLARFKGNHKHAIRYCVRTARQYRHLRAEYRHYVLALRCMALLGK
jgi:hypothetical protein